MGHRAEQLHARAGALDAATQGPVARDHEPRVDGDVERPERVEQVLDPLLHVEAPYVGDGERARGNRALGRLVDVVREDHDFAGRTPSTREVRGSR